ncbi:hypothetical protein [Allokutzneria sp. NRRL B-24872]|uniref:hypothetical protein n=1 Tax=Allokutzneria sp. NRRL B-24872 TaxID=1137961 RepID=UPI000A3AF44F|nr:hypothetical protein [Allokutzneria sp. NRRL B-24872]
MTNRLLAARLPGWTQPTRELTNAWIPGRVLGGLTLLLGPVVWLAALIVRHVAREIAVFTPQEQAWFDRQTFDAPEQLAAYEQHPGLVTAGFVLYAVAAILMIPAVLTFGRVVAARSPRLAFWGTLLVIASLFAKGYFSGINQTAFQLVDKLGLEQATTFVLESYVDLSYGLWRVPVWVTFGALLGMALLAVGAYRVGVFGLVRCALLVIPGIAHGILKESALLDVAIAAIPCLALIPLGLNVLRDRVPELATARRLTDRAAPRVLSW